MLRILLLLPILLAACPSPAVSQSPYPQNPAVSDAQGQPRDSSTFYFPGALLSKPDSATGQWPAELPLRAEYCREVFGAASANLYCFGAPVLSNYYLGYDTYRFLWLRAFHRPVLLTLTRQAGGATLRTQWLSKWAGLPKVQLSTIGFTSHNQPPAEREWLRAADRAYRTDPKVLRELAERNRPAEQLPQLETTYLITLPQWQQFERLLQQSGFQQQTSCEMSPVTDGADWLLEAHTAGGYHIVNRHSPEKPDSFRQACEYLLDLSSARRERRY